MSWQENRDWALAEELKDFGEDSYDFVGRDVWLEGENGSYKADLFFYRSENHLVEVKWFYEENGVERDEIMEILGEVRDILSEESFKPRLSFSSDESMRPDYVPETNLKYAFDHESNVKEILGHLDSVVADL